MISLTASVCKHAYQVTEMDMNDKQVMNSCGITCSSKDVYVYKGLRYERLAGAACSGEIDVDRARLGGGDS